MLEKLSTENRNARTMNLDEMSTTEILKIMNEEDRTVPLAIQKEIKAIEKLVQQAIHTLKRGGRIIYLGAGTSGRLGILDAVECVPTFGISPDMVRGLIAGGEKAMMIAVEGAEDSEELASRDLTEVSLTEKDLVIGIAASGRTPYVIGGLKKARQVGAYTGSIACNKDSEISNYAEIAIEIKTGSEILTGSTRLKAGTAQKLVLNMISTATMIGIGKVYKNLMVDVQPTNLKLIERSKRIIMQASETDYQTAGKFYNAANGNVKTAIVMILTKCSIEEAQNRLKQSEGFVKKAL
ncbi:N-acetylmuramic acid 6-phosphate etherase [Peribacillus cavernae]|uniref:N-acetylmuramic acid 6-phosphate etherase n=1 Tax=Peribacillus cavernae TaxID=1674310 RepID=A0A3S0W943_9BACI|nr:N-acetylmuramic acid 6-phosphate etherase [Peribacillus cavernae]MDQ0217093.1 N-acetylmuramic acid 6-phosphate etherase [Peribacillus cavernae]RUQ30430.1 N-acetylmuramic acid 6-phosphate etherase [Peribacillus cavernae]